VDVKRAADLYAQGWTIDVSDAAHRPSLVWIDPLVQTDSPERDAGTIVHLDSDAQARPSQVSKLGRIHRFVSGSAGDNEGMT
jgi:hypothetical protein